MNHQSRSYIYIRIYGDSFLPEKLTEILNIKPTSTGLKGQPGKYAQALRECYWEFKLDETDALDELDVSLNKLVEIFDAKKGVIKNFLDKNRLGVKCHVVIKSLKQEDTGVLFNSKFIDFIHDLGAELEVNTYNV